MLGALYALIELFTNKTYIRTLVTAFERLNEEIRIANLVTFDLEDSRIPQAILRQIQGLLTNPTLQWLRKDPTVFPDAKPSLRIIDKRTLQNEVRIALENLNNIPLLVTAPLPEIALPAAPVPDPDLAIPVDAPPFPTEEGDDTPLPDADAHEEDTRTLPPLNLPPLNPALANAIARFTANML